jgi:hypothetical protein
VKKTARRTENSFFFDAFNDTEPMVRVDDLVADLECHVSPVAGRRMGRTGLGTGYCVHEYSPLARASATKNARKLGVLSSSAGRLDASLRAVSFDRRPR